MSEVRDQLEMFGLEGARRLAEAAGASPREKSRLVRRVETAHEIMAALPTGDELSIAVSVRHAFLTADRPKITLYGSAGRVGSA